RKKIAHVLHPVAVARSAGERGPASWQDGTVRSPKRPRGRAADAAIALAFLVVVLVPTIWAELRDDGRARVPGLGWGLILIACGALYWWRRRPTAVLVATLVACALYYPLTEPDGPVLIAFVAALYNAAAQGRVLA